MIIHVYGDASRHEFIEALPGEWNLTVRYTRTGYKPTSVCVPTIAMQLQDTNAAPEELPVWFPKETTDGYEGVPLADDDVALLAANKDTIKILKKIKKGAKPNLFIFQEIWDWYAQLELYIEQPLRDIHVNHTLNVIEKTCPIIVSSHVFMGAGHLPLPVASLVSHDIVVMDGIAKYKREEITVDGFMNLVLGVAVA